MLLSLGALAALLRHSESRLGSVPRFVDITDMRALPILRSLFVAGLLGAATGCFALDELDKASALSKGPAAGGDKAAAAKPGAAKPAADAASGAQLAAPSEKSWWQTARTLSSDDSDAGITRCELAGRSEFMLRDDCVARGGHPK